MTSIEAIILVIGLLTGGGYISGTDNKLEKPYKTFQNTYLKFIILDNTIVANTQNEKTYSLSFDLRLPKEKPFEFFGVYLRTYEIGFDKNWLNTYYNMGDSVPQEILEQPTKYFLKNCEYQIPLPAGDFALITYGNPTFVKRFFRFGFFTPVSLKSNQTLYLKLIYDKDSKLSDGKVEIITTPPDIKEIKKCVID